jgi:tyrosine-protein kinase
VDERDRDSLHAAPMVAPADRASDHLRALGRRWWLIAACSVLAGVGAYELSKQQKPRYHATAKVLLVSAEPVNLLSHSTAAPSLDPERELNTDIALVKLDSVASDVRQRLGLSLTNEELLREVGVSADGLSSLITITASDHSPAKAAAIANAFAARYIQVRREQAQAAYRNAANLAQGRLDQLDEAERAGPQGATLLQRLHQLQATGELQTGGAQLVDPAQVPTTAATPRPKFSAIVGAFIGAIIGAVAALLAGVTDRRREKLAALAARNGHPDVELPKPATTPELPPPTHRTASRD